MGTKNGASLPPTDRANGHKNIQKKGTKAASDTILNYQQQRGQKKKKKKAANQKKRGNNEKTG